MKRQLSLFLVLALLMGLVSAVPVRAEEIPDVTDYSYTVTPLLSPFTYYLYVQTDNPDPTSFRLMDKSSAYYQEGDRGRIYFESETGSHFAEIDPGTYCIDQNLYPDVVYEDESTWRVKGGYIFRADSAYSDGGELVLMQKTITGENIGEDCFAETDITVTCEPLHTRVTYLVDTATTEDMTFFEKLDAVQSLLGKIAVYPRAVYDSDSPNESLPYPLLAASPYPELELNAHFNMYEYLSSGILASETYPFVLDSLGVPGTIASVAKALEPGCEAVRGDFHYQVNVTFEGETRTYGGAGAGRYDPLYSEHAQTAFTFQGGTDLGLNGSMDAYYELLRSYDDICLQDATAYYDLITGETFHKTIRATGGTWIRILMEGGGTTLAYAVPLGDNDTLIASECWADGRYINEHEVITLGSSFEDHPAADILLHDVTFTDYHGVTRTQDVIYSYDETHDAWTAPGFYEGLWYANYWPLPDELVLTREEVAALDPDCNTNSLPGSALIYDGSAYPGTPFTLVNVTGVAVPDAKTLHPEDNVTLEAIVMPLDAYDTSVRWTSSDPAVVEVLSDSYGIVQAVSEGTAVLTATTTDGAYTASCTITVKADPCKDGHHYGDWAVTQAPTCTEAGVETRTCIDCGDVQTQAAEATGHSYGNWTVTQAPTCTEAGIETQTCTGCGDIQTQAVDAAGHSYTSGICTVCGAEQPFENPFRDVAQTDYFYNPVLWAVRREITNGYGADDIFNPEGICTRGQVVTFLWRAQGQPEPAANDNPFKDVAEQDYFYKAVLWAVEQGITNGYGAEDIFNPDGECTRGQVVTFLWRAQNCPVPTSNDCRFADVAQADYFCSPVLWAVENGVTNGYGSETRFAPEVACTRGQIVTFLYRVLAE